MMFVVVINTGSSSIKFSLFSFEKNLEKPFSALKQEKLVCSGVVEQIFLEKGKLKIFSGKRKFLYVLDKPTYKTGIDAIIEKLKTLGFLKDKKEIFGIGYRVVHGGDTKKATILSDKIIEKLDKCVNLAPLHNPGALEVIKIISQRLKGVPSVLVFDTSFHSTIPKRNFLYAVPYDWYKVYGVKRYGFHGISYDYVLNVLMKVLALKKDEVNAVICHLGNGASICGIKNGKSYNTSMGFTPLEGLIMGTRSGNIDPAIISYMQKNLHLTTKEIIDDFLNKKSGLLAVSGVSSDMRFLENKIGSSSSSSRAELALDMFAQRVADYIVTYSNQIGKKTTVIVFTAGIGENSAFIRQKIISFLPLLPIKFSEKKNYSSLVKKRDFSLISFKSSIIKVFVIKTNEELMICQEVIKLLSLKG